MANNIMERVDDYLNLYGEIKQRVEDESTARAIMSEVSKDRRMDEIRREQEGRDGEPATAKQLAFLKDLGVSYRKGITKREASELLNEALGRD
jgi:hypothetical protein